MLRSEAFAHCKECGEVIFKDVIGDQDLEMSELAIEKRVWKSLALLVMFLGPKALRTGMTDRKISMECTLGCVSVMQLKWEPVVYNWKRSSTKCPTTLA